MTKEYFVAQEGGPKVHRDTYERLLGKEEGYEMWN